MQRKTKTAPRKSKRDVPVLLCEYPVSTLVFEDEIDVINVDPVVVPSGCRRLPYVREPVETSSSVREPVEFLASSIQCGCGSWITSKTKSKHLKTKKHGLWMLGQPCADCVV